MNDRICKDTPRGSGEDDFEAENGSSQSMDGADGADGAERASQLKEITDASQAETNRLRQWRLILLLAMLVTGCLTSLGAFYYLREMKTRDALHSFHQFATTAKTTSSKHFDDFILTMTTMGQTVTMAGLSSESSFPFVRVPLFEIPAHQTRLISGEELVSWNPFVTERQRLQWSTFVRNEFEWYEESKRLLASTDSMTFGVAAYDTNTSLREYIWSGNRSLHGSHVVAPPGRVFAPVWQCSPPPYSPAYLNFDLMSEQIVLDMIPSLKETRGGTEFQSAFHSQYSTTIGNSSSDHPHSIYLQPVFKDVATGSKSDVVGFLSSIVAWDYFLAGLVNDGVKGVTAVLKNDCAQAYTYQLDGQFAAFLGVGDLHTVAYDWTEVVVPMAPSSRNETIRVPGHCTFTLSLYYSDSFQSESADCIDIICTLAIAAIFASLTAIFFVYDSFVRRRNAKIVIAAARTSAIVSSLFPTQVRDRLFANDGKPLDSGVNSEHEHLLFKTIPIADLFTETTILFADIVGFTAWSSQREPSQVFILLETVFGAFDAIAKRRRIFKVETVGDCYVAVAGLPEARSDHAVAIARFARDCMQCMVKLTRDLVTALGPDTEDLAMRMGIHSGPVTAGVLRGERSRFQLFGDTMNTAARMESNGVRNKIQLSQDTAKLLTAAGKSNWISKRPDAIQVKGKGEMQTYWLGFTGTAEGDSSTVDLQNGGSCSEETGQASGSCAERTTRLVEWHVKVLTRLLKQIQVRRLSRSALSSDMTVPNEDRFRPTGSTGKQVMPIDEVKEIVTLPQFQTTSNGDLSVLEQVELDPRVLVQLQTFVRSIAHLYNDGNPFHNFEHATHVALSVVKLLSRIVAPVGVLQSQKAHGRVIQQHGSKVPDHTYGITSDPLTQFSCVIAALIHDVDHPGVSNGQLIQEGGLLAERYHNQSMAEQNSVDLAWNLLFSDDYTVLRRAIYETDAELDRFRQVLVNAVMATDIVDKELKQLRNARWDRAFAPSLLGSADSESTNINRKATIVIEHLIQASDVAHTMQHWHVYRKWNERYFMECYQAYADGRVASNPADGWYEGELGFFDFYIIPLAKKLQDCGVFGVSSDEYLMYAMANRREWESKGRDVVHAMVELVQQRCSAEGTCQ